MSSPTPFDLDTKTKYLKEAAGDAHACHPDNTPYTLVCPISGVLYNNPVITPKGFVYNRSEIIDWLTQKAEDPQTREPLNISNLKPFPELLPIINTFMEKKTYYLKRKEALIQNARALVREIRDITYLDAPPKIPNLFICPIRHTLIKTPVITATGKLYDKDNLKEYLTSTNNTDEAGAPLSMKDVVEFDDFKQQLKTYQFYQNRALKRRQVLSTPMNSPFNFFNLTTWTSWFWRHNEQQEPQSLDIKM